MIAFLDFACFVCFIIMLANAKRSRELSEFPFFGVSAILLIGISVIVFQLRTFGTLDAKLLAEYTAKHFNMWVASTLFVAHLFIGACYSLFMWRFRVLPEVKDRITDLLRKQNKNEMLMYFDREFYSPKDNEHLILPVLSYHSSYLIWLIWFWPFDFVTCILGNWFTILFFDLPKAIGTFVYNTIKNQFEQIARNFLK